MADTRTAMVLAAGFGERLRPLTLERPKPLLEIKGTPILHIVLKLLAREGFGKVIINLHHLGHMIRESVGDGDDFGMDIVYSEEKEILGTGGGIKSAQKLIGEDTFLVMNGDLLVDAPLDDIWKQHKRTGAAATLVLKDDPSIPGYGAVKVDSNMRVRRILDKPPCDEELKPMLFTGIQVLEPDFFEFVEYGKKASSTQDVYPKMLDKGLIINYYLYTGLFLDIGTPEMYEYASNMPRFDRI